jgi:hypothetical protein
VNKKISSADEFKSRWENIIAEAEISEVPFSFLNEIQFHFEDGTTHSFNILDLLKIMTLEEIEQKIRFFLSEFDQDEIDSIDFHINIEAVAEVVDEKTKGLLGD